MFKASGSKVQVILNGVSLGTFSPTGTIIGLGHGGNDRIEADSKLNRERMFYGGAGNDTVKGGNGSGILIGGDGNDDLSSGNARDILIGGRGAEKMNGGNGDDVIIAGHTNYDEPTTFNQNALCMIQKECGRGRTWATRRDWVTWPAARAA